MTQLHEVHVPRVAEDLTECLLLWSQDLVSHSKQKITAGCPLILQILPEGLVCRASLQVVLQKSTLRVRLRNTCLQSVGLDKTSRSLEDLCSPVQAFREASSESLVCRASGQIVLKKSASHSQHDAMELTARLLVRILRLVLICFLTPCWDQVCKFRLRQSPSTCDAMRVFQEQRLGVDNVAWPHVNTGPTVNTCRMAMFLRSWSLLPPPGLLSPSVPSPLL